MPTHTLLCVYRVFLPVLAQLDTTGMPQLGTRVSAKKRIVYMEKLVAALLLVHHEVTAELDAAIHVTEVNFRNHERAGHSSFRSAGNPDYFVIAKDLAAKLKVLRALKELFTFWCPALFRLGYMVRQCYWEGRPGGTVTGRTAYSVLVGCLLLQTHLLDDWDGRTEYVRTMAVAVATWHPWLMDRPGCIFVEEAGEALLSRFMGRVRDHPKQSSFEGAHRLFITLEKASPVATETRGSIRAQLVELMQERVVALIHSTERLLFPQIANTSTGLGTWVVEFPGFFRVSGTIPGSY